ncbi:hypothetical protein ACFSSA_03470 [Luteolibacter algae]|uniref:Four helix bundle protein n=1 Tax=Luteolibacter algae TaxID=454151 RepID=A0ABW5D4Q0_9BACT
MSDFSNDFEIYSDALRLGEVVWNSVIKWDYSGKDLIGTKLVHAVDRLIAIIAEARNSSDYPEIRRSRRAACSCIAEAAFWLGAAERQKSISRKDARLLNVELESLHHRLSTHIKPPGPKTDPPASSK